MNFITQNKALTIVGGIAATASMAFVIFAVLPTVSLDRDASLTANIFSVVDAYTTGGSGTGCGGCGEGGGETNDGDDYSGAGNDTSDAEKVPACTSLTANGKKNLVLKNGSETVKFAWKTENASKAQLTTQGQVKVNGSEDILVFKDFTYTLTAISANGVKGSKTCSVTVKVEKPKVVTPDPTCSLNGSPMTLPAGGGNVTLTWNSANANHASIDMGVTGVVPNKNGSQMVSVAATKTFTMTVSGNGKTIKCPKKITVGDPKPGTPNIKIVKFDPVDGDDTQTVAKGGVATFRIAVTNTGSVALKNVRVTDPITPACDKVIGALAIGERIAYSCESTNVQNSFTNVADVTGRSVVDDTVVDDTDPTNVVVPGTVGTPNIKIVKFDPVDGDDTQTVAKGGVATFRIAVTNTGSVALKNVRVTDPITPACDKVIGALAIGERIAYSCESTNVQNSFTNVADVTGRSVVDDTVVDDTDPTNVVVPGTVGTPNIKIVKFDPVDGDDTQTVAKGGVATFRIAVTNTGSVALKNVRVTDPITPACDKVIGALAIGERIAYSCESTNVQNSFTNVADVTGRSVVDDTVVDDTDPTNVVVPGTTAAPSCDSFTTNDASVRPGQSVTLSWNTTNATIVSINQGVGTNLAVDGSIGVTVNNDITYTLTAENAAGTKVTCPVTVNVDNGGGSSSGGGSSTPRCDLDISDENVKVGEEVTLKWDTSRATEVTLKDHNGKVIFTTEDYSGSKKRDYYDHEVDVVVTKNTTYTLIAERGSKDRECKVSVDVDKGNVLVLTEREQPLVAGIALTQLPYTGFEAGPAMTIIFYTLLTLWALFVAYVVVVKQGSVLGFSLNGTNNAPVDAAEEMYKKKLHQLAAKYSHQSPRQW